MGNLDVKLLIDADFNNELWSVNHYDKIEKVTAFGYYFRLIEGFVKCDSKRAFADCRPEKLAEAITKMIEGNRSLSLSSKLALIGQLDKLKKMNNSDDSKLKIEMYIKSINLGLSEKNKFISKLRLGDLSTYSQEEINSFLTMEDILEEICVAPLDYVKSLVPENVALNLKLDQAEVEIINRNLFVTDLQKIQLKNLIMGKSSFIDYLSAHPGIVPRSFFNSLLAAGLPVTKNSIDWSLHFHQNKLLKLLWSNIPSGFMEKMGVTLLEVIRDSENWQALDLLFPEGLDFSVAEESFYKCLKEGDAPLIVEMIKRGARITSQEKYEDVLKLALQTHNLGLIRTICLNGAGKDVKAASYPEVLGFNEKRKEIFLRSAILNSALEEIYALVEKYPEFSSLKDLLPEYLDKVSAVVRFPKKYRLPEQNNLLDDEYIDRTWAYSEENLKINKRIQEELKKGTTWNSILKMITEDRFSRLVGNKDLELKMRELLKITDSQWRSFAIAEKQYTALDYINKYSDDKAPSYTNIVSFKINDDLSVEAVSSRYRPSLNMFFDRYDLDASFSNDWRKQHKNLEVAKYVKNDLLDSRGFDKSELMFTFKYPLSERQAVPTTSLLVGNIVKEKFYKILWVHTSTKSVNQLEEHLEELFQASLNKDSRAEFKKSVALFYWHVATQCQMARGTPHNAMMILRALYEYQGLPMPIPKICDSHGYQFNLDNTALMFTPEEFVEQWDQFFEPPYK